MLDTNSINERWLPRYKCGPSGGDRVGANSFSDDAIVAGERVAEIRVWAFGYIDAIQIVHKRNPVIHEFDKHGGNGGIVNVFTLDDDEFITGISGRYGGVIDSLQIHTNKQTSPEYGGTGGNIHYEYICPEGIEIAGFFGRTGVYNGYNVIANLGVIMRNQE